MKYLIYFIILFCISSCCPPFCGVRTQAQHSQDVDYVLKNVSPYPIILNEWEGCSYVSPCCGWTLCCSIPINGKIRIPCASGQVRKFRYNNRGINLCGPEASTFSISGVSGTVVDISLY